MPRQEVRGRREVRGLRAQGSGRDTYHVRQIALRGGAGLALPPSTFASTFSGVRARCLPAAGRSLPPAGGPENV